MKNNDIWNKESNHKASPQKGDYEFCPRCEANLTLQKGYRNDLSYWVCRGCGEMLFHPDIEAEDDIVWVCDGCGAMLNIQPGFRTDCGIFTCTECGVKNPIDPSQIYASEGEFQADLRNPFRGMPDASVMELMKYQDVHPLQDKAHIMLVRDPETGRLYVKKTLTTYDAEVFRYLMEHPPAHMPRIIGVYEGARHLVIIEEYIEGRNLSSMLSSGKIDPGRAVSYALRIARILRDLHRLPRPIIHRDIKPSNIMVDRQDRLYLIDVNVAKWYHPEETEDTRLLGTLYYAAPEQFGYGFSASTEKADIYGLGILLNVMLTGRLPKEERAEGALWDVIERCIRLNPEERYTDDELIKELEGMAK